MRQASLNVGVLRLTMTSILLLALHIMHWETQSRSICLQILRSAYPTNTPRGFYVETTWKRSNNDLNFASSITHYALRNSVSKYLFANSQICLPYKHTTWILRWNDVETVVSTSFQRRIHVVCLQPKFWIRWKKRIIWTNYFLLFLLSCAKTLSRQRF